MRPALSPPAAGLLRGLVARAAVPRESVLLSRCRSVDWQSLTFVGERHEIELTLLPPSADAAAARIADGLADALWAIPSHIVADIALMAPATRKEDGSVLLRLEALTLSD